MLLEELTTSDLDFLAKTLSGMEGLGAWQKLHRVARNPDALKMAVRLYNWAIENGSDFSKHYQSLSILQSTRSTGGTLSPLRTLEPTGFVNHPLIRVLQTEALAGSLPSFRTARAEAMPFVTATRHLFYHLKVLGDVATEGTERFEGNDGLNRKLAAAALRKLGVKGNNLMVKA